MVVAKASLLSLQSRNVHPIEKENRYDDYDRIRSRLADSKYLKSLELHGHKNQRRWHDMKYFEDNRAEVRQIYRNLLKATASVLPRKIERGARLAEFKHMFRVD